MGCVTKYTVLVRDAAVSQHGMFVKGFHLTGVNASNTYLEYKDDGISYNNN